MQRTIETARLRLAPICAEDEDDWWSAIWSDSEVTRYLPPRRPLPREHMARMLEKAREEWETHQFGLWAIRDRETGDFVGHCGLVINHPPRVELIYALARDAWGRGLVSEAAAAVISYAGFALGITELDALVFEENLASARVLEKLGFSPVGPVHRLGHDLQLYSYPAARAREANRSALS